MRRPIQAAAAALALSAAVAAPAAADTIELGLPTSHSQLSPPTCPPKLDPSLCTIILTQVTALETIRDGIAYPTTVTRPGYVVAFTLGLSRLNSDPTAARNAVQYLDGRWGGTARAAVTILKPVGKRKYRRFAVAAASEVIHLQPYLGTVSQFPLQKPLRVLPGEVVALTTPTWAPVLSFNQPVKRYAYRQSRSHSCASPPASSQAQSTVGQSARYICDYPGTRVEYSATEITDPRPARHQIH